MVSMFNNIPVSKVSFPYCALLCGCIVIILKMEKKHTADILYVILEFQILILYFYNVFK